MLVTALLISAAATLDRALLPAAHELGVPALEAVAAPIVPYAEISDEPERFLGTQVRLLFQHHSERETWNPYMTSFSPGRFRALDGWTDEQRLWRRYDFDAPAARVYVLRDSRADSALTDARVHQRWMLTGVVREEHLGKPWIEITHAIEMRSHVPEGSVLHAIRAFEFVDKEAFALARDEFARALAAPLPEAVARELEGWRARCAKRLEPAPRRSGRSASTRARSVVRR